MFATLLGPLPRPPLDGAADPLDVLDAVVRAQELAGLDPLIDAGFGIGETATDRWRTTAGLTDRAVKATLLGPLSMAQAANPGLDISAVADAAYLAAEACNADLLELAAAGCPWIEIHEPAATLIGADEVRRTLFREVHRRALRGVAGTHVSLAITGGNADVAGVATLLAAPYASLAVDLIAGPDNWRLIVAAPPECGIVCGALSSARDADDRPEVLLWAAGYAASTAGRGAARVGLASASSLAALPWEVAVRKLGILGEAARLAGLPAEERRRQMDPRAVDSRSAALGRVERRPVRRQGPGPS
jgi:methionine synthase II (cobalamin-independent)